MNISNSQTTIDLSDHTIKLLKNLHVVDSEIRMEFWGNGEEGVVEDERKEVKEEVKKEENVEGEKKEIKKVKKSPTALDENWDGKYGFNSVNIVMTEGKKLEVKPVASDNIVKFEGKMVEVKSVENEDKKEEVKSVEKGETGYFNSKMRECNEEVIYEDDGDCTVFTTSLPLSVRDAGMEEPSKDFWRPFYYDERTVENRKIEKVSVDKILEALKGEDPVIGLFLRNGVDRKQRGPFEKFYKYSQLQTFEQGKGKLKYKHIRFMVTDADVHVATTYPTAFPRTGDGFYLANWGDKKYLEYDSIGNELLERLESCEPSDQDVSIPADEDDDDDVDYIGSYSTLDCGSFCQESRSE